MGCAASVQEGELQLAHEPKDAMFDKLQQYAAQMGFQLQETDRQYIEVLNVKVLSPSPKFLFLATSRSFDYGQALGMCNFNNSESHLRLETPVELSMPHMMSDSEVASSEHNQGAVQVSAPAASGGLVLSVLLYAEERGAVSLNLTRQPLPPDLMPVLSACSRNLRALSLVQCGLNVERGAELAESIQEYDTLEYVNLSRNPLTDVAAVQILQALRTHRNLEFLALAQTQTRDLTVRVFVEAFARSRLRGVDLSDNAGISRDSIQHLLLLSRYTPSLFQINILNSQIQNKTAQIQKFLRRNQIAAEVFWDLQETCLNKVLGETEHVREDVDNHAPKHVTARDFFTELELISVAGQRLFEEKDILELSSVLKKNRPRIEPKWNKNISIAQAETMGRRQEMEDFVYINEHFYQFRARRGKMNSRNLKEQLVALFDGHGGRDCSTMLGEIVPVMLADALNAIEKTLEIELFELPESFWNIFMAALFEIIDQTLKKRGVVSGSTAAIVLILHSLAVVANCGDSRVVLARSRAVARSRGVDVQNYIVRKLVPKISTANRETEQSEHLSLHFQSESGQAEQLDLAIRLSVDHKAGIQSEVQRIEESGGFVEDGRLEGLLAVSRSFGDFEYKPLLTARPHVRTYDFCDKDYGLIVACDGVWDVISDFDGVILCLQTNTSQAAAIKIRDEAYKLESQDNISCVVAKIE